MADPEHNSTDLIDFDLSRLSVNTTTGTPDNRNNDSIEVQNQFQYACCAGPVSDEERAYLLEHGFALENSQGSLYGEPSTIIDTSDEDEEVQQAVIDIGLQQPEIDVEVQQAEIDVEVQQAEIDVEVQQAVVDVEVQQAVIDVEVQQAEIDVEVQQAEIDVEVQQAEIDVEVQQAEIDVEVQQAEIDVEVQQAEIDVEDKQAVVDVEDKQAVIDVAVCESMENSSIDNFLTASFNLSASSSGDEFNDTITRMEIMLAMADAAAAEDEKNKQIEDLPAAFSSANRDESFEAAEHRIQNLFTAVGTEEEKNSNFLFASLSSPPSQRRIIQLPSEDEATSAYEMNLKRTMPIMAGAEDQKCMKMTTDNIFVSPQKKTHIQPPIVRIEKKISTEGKNGQGFLRQPVFKTPFLPSTPLSNRAKKESIAFPLKSPSLFDLVCQGSKAVSNSTPIRPHEQSSIEATITSPMSSICPSPIRTPKSATLQKDKKTPTALLKKSCKKGAYTISSPVAKYIYSQPSPSLIQRAVKTADNSAEKKINLKTKVTGIPLSLPQKSGIPIPRRLTNAANATSNILQEAKQNAIEKPDQLFVSKIRPLKSLVYVSSDKLREKFAKVESAPVLQNLDWKSQRHLGVRDENNASIVQPEHLNKAYIPDRVKDYKKQ